LKRLRASGWLWQDIADLCGENRGSIHNIATGEYKPSEEVAMRLMNSLPEYLKESTEKLERRVWEIVRTRIGPENAIPQKEVARMIGVPVRRVRIITLALLEKNYPVGTVTGLRKKKGEPPPPRGLYRMNNEEHQGAYADQLWSRVRNTAYRARLVDALDLGDGKVKQMEMFG